MSKSSNTEISIIVPCYNVEKSVKRCLHSIESQTYQNFEALIIDDGSTDDSKNIIQTTIKNDSRFKYYYKKNGGLSSARNYGLKKAKGKYVCFIDSDDYIDKNYLKLLIESIKNTHSDIAVCSFNRVYPNKIKPNPVKNSFSELIKYTAVWNKLYKTSLFKENDIKFPEGMWYEDLGTLPKLFMFSPKISVVNQPLYNYIINNSSITHTYDNRIYQVYDIVENLEKFAENHNLYNKYHTELEFIHIYHILAGTIYRISFKDDFNPNTIKDIHDYVESKYPKWFENHYISTLPFYFKVFLFLLRKRQYQLIYYLVRSLNHIIIL